MFLRNEGLGPAQIQDVVLTVNGRRTSVTGQGAVDFSDLLGLEDEWVARSHVYRDLPRPLRPGGEHQLVELIRPSSCELAEAMWSHWDRILQQCTVEVAYTDAADLRRESESRTFRGRAAAVKMSPKLSGLRSSLGSSPGSPSGDGALDL